MKGFLVFFLSGIIFGLERRAKDNDKMCAPKWKFLIMSLHFFIKSGERIDKEKKSMYTNLKVKMSNNRLSSLSACIVVRPNQVSIN